MAPSLCIESEERGGERSEVITAEVIGESWNEARRKREVFIAIGSRGKDLWTSHPSNATWQCFTGTKYRPLSTHYCKAARYEV